MEAEGSVEAVSATDVIPPDPVIPVPALRIPSVAANTTEAPVTATFELFTAVAVNVALVVPPSG